MFNWKGLKMPEFCSESASTRTYCLCGKILIRSGFSLSPRSRDADENVVFCSFNENLIDHIKVCTFVSLDFCPFVSMNFAMWAAVSFFISLSLAISFYCALSHSAVSGRCCVFWKNTNVDLRVIRCYKCQLNAATTIYHTKMSSLIWIPFFLKWETYLHVSTIYSDGITITVQ